MDNIFSETLDWMGLACAGMVLISEMFLAPAAVCYSFSFAVRWGNSQRLQDYMRKLKGR